MLFRQTVLIALATLPFSLAQISDNFENGWDQTLWPIYAPDCNQGGTVSLDTTTGHSGTNSMKVVSPGGYCGHIFFGTTEVPSGDIYVRVWLKASVALTANHVSFIVMPDTAEGSNEHLRIGGQEQILMYNRQVDDATLPDLSPQGVASSEALPTGSWQCFEYHLGTNGSIETWLNSNAIPGLTTENNPNDQGWTRNLVIPNITGVYFGWESYGSDANTFWYDDIAISSSRVGCAVSGTSPSSVPATSTTASATTMTTSVKVSMTTTSAAPSSTTSAVGTVPLWGQCGGTGWTGGTVCETGTCVVSNPYYSQCLQ